MHPGSSDEKMARILFMACSLTSKEICSPGWVCWSNSSNSLSVSITSLSESGGLNDGEYGVYATSSGVHPISGERG